MMRPGSTLLSYVFEYMGVRYRSFGVYCQGKADTTYGFCGASWKKVL
jgi:hypothetical protein